jgi:hypothetical protein
MKRLFLHVLLLVNFNNEYVKSQTIDTLPWCPEGAVWIYGGIHSNLYRITFINDSTVNDEIAKLFSVEIATKDIGSGTIITDYIPSQNQPNFLLKEKNDSIFFYWEKDEDPNEWIFIYDFKAIEGQKYYTTNHYFNAPCSLPDSSIISYDTILVQLQERTLIVRKSFDFVGADSVSYFYPQVLPNIGAFRIPFPKHDDITLGCYPSEPFIRWPFGYPEASLLCYKDDLRGSINFNQLNHAYSCDSYITTIYSTDQPMKKPILYPNPTTDRLTVKNIPPKCDVEIIDYKGNKLARYQSQDGSLEINIKTLKQGMYLLNVSIDGKSVYLEKFVKN